jgi:hypothetical protein
MNPNVLVNPLLVVLLTLSLIGSYFAWGWSIVALAAVVALTRPWLDGHGLEDRMVVRLVDRAG